MKIGLRFRGKKPRNAIRERNELTKDREEFRYTYYETLDIPQFTDVVNSFGDKLPIPPIYIQRSDYTYAGIGSVMRKHLGVHQISKNAEFFSSKDVTRTFFTCGKIFSEQSKTNQLVMINYVCLKECIIRPSWSKWYLDYLESIFPICYHRYEQLLGTYKTSTGRRENGHAMSNMKSMADPEEVARVILTDMFGMVPAWECIRDCNAPTMRDMRDWCVAGTEIAQ